MTNTNTDVEVILQGQTGEAGSTAQNVYKNREAILRLADGITDLEARVTLLEGVEYGMRRIVGASSPTVEKCIRKNGVIYTEKDVDLHFTLNSDGTFDSAYTDFPIWGEIERVYLSGQVMSRVPKYYILVETIGVYEYTWVCKIKREGYRCAGIFLKADGITENEYYYLGSYESTNGALGISQSGMKYDSDDMPYTTGYTLAEYREAAQKLGDGWGITPIAEVCDLWQILIPIEFGTLDVQGYAAGICTVVDPPVDEMFPDLETPYRTGNCDNVANLHGVACLHENSPGGKTYNYKGQTGANCGGNPFVWHGIENPYGCIEKWIDGLTFNNGKAYACNDKSKFATDSIADYTALSYDVCGEYGYVKALGYDEAVPWCRLPTEVTQESDTYYCDDWEPPYTAGFSCASFGGDCIYYVSAGAWYVYADYRSSYRFCNVGSRLSYTPV